MKTISTVKQQIRAQQKHRHFPTVDYAERVSHLDPDSEFHDFRGFYVLFWVGLAMMVITTVVRNIKDTGHPFRVHTWSLLTADVLQLAIADVCMVGTTVLALPMHFVYKNSRGWMQWGRGGMFFHSFFQMGWLILWIWLPFVLGWSWTAQVFFTLHTLTILMKLHSWAFYNGHLSETERRLRALDQPEGASRTEAVRYPSVSGNIPENSPERRRQSDHRHQQHHHPHPQSISSLRDDLATELTSPMGAIAYPANLTLANFTDYLLCPTLCYELQYPRTKKFRPLELFGKTAAIFGCIFLLVVISEEFIIPITNEAAINLELASKFSDKALLLAETISLLLFPFMITFLLVFLVIFEYVLGAFAEITGFADRRFFQDWWNSTDWLEFSREWNIPVHNFFRRHVYSASLPHLSRSAATLITFLISSLAHELVMACITKKIRGYGFFAMMMQLPIVMVQRSRWVRSKKTFSNVFFWISIILGLSVMCAFYVLV